MTSKQFKQSINSELRDAGFANKIKRCDEDTIFRSRLYFESMVDEKLETWFNSRFRYGVTITDEHHRTISINSPGDKPVDTTTAVAFTRMVFNGDVDIVEYDTYKMARDIMEAVFDKDDTMCQFEETRLENGKWAITIRNAGGKIMLQLKTVNAIISKH
jgi:hypothetical protein